MYNAREELQATLRVTNSRWNELKLNTPWSVGYVSKLINDRKFDSFDEWAEYYYESGKKRQEEIAKLTTEQKILLNRHDISAEDKAKLTPEMIKLNTDYGRTKAELMERAMILYGAELGAGNPHDIQPEMARLTVIQRVLHDVYDGIVRREANTIKTLQERFDDVEFKELQGQEDTDYAVDYEIYKDGNLAMGLQIKPTSYRGDRPYLRDAKRINELKNKAYSDLKGVPVMYVYSTMGGSIQNMEIWGKMAKILEN